MPQIYPHRIRLRGPWECEPLARLGGGSLPAPRRLTMPCRWGEAGLADFAGTIRFLRRFHWPSGIDPLERVWLTCAGLTGTANVSLNGQPLGQHAAAFDVEVTPLLQARNVLVVELTADTPAGGLWGEIGLEVRRTAYLRGVQVEPAGADWRIRGAVVGVADRPLELYVLADNATAAYQTIQAEPQGRDFDLVIQPPQPPRQIRVELIDGGVVWYHVEWDTAR